MAVKKAPKAETEKSEGNVENLAGLTKEFVGGKMLPRKQLMLKHRLVELWNAKNIAEGELKLLKTIFQREFKRGNIEDRHLEIFNRIEEAECTEKCRCKDDNAPRVFYVAKDQVCSFRREEQTNIEKVEKGSLFQYIVFVEKIVPPEFQMTRELLLKEERGHHAAESEYPKEKILLHRLQLDDVWFDKVFDIEEDLLSESVEGEDEAEYKF
jgi:hypothetical protein